MGSVVVLVFLMMILMSTGKMKSKFDFRDFIIPLLLALLQTALVLYDMFNLPWPQ